MVSATCVRVPVFTGHSLALTAEFRATALARTGDRDLEPARGVELSDLPTPRLADGKDPCYVGRIRRAETLDNGLSLFVSGDNLRKGAALNAMQIAEALLELRLVGAVAADLSAREIDAVIAESLVEARDAAPLRPRPARSSNPRSTRR